jgi:hypothetical protein
MRNAKRAAIVGLPLLGIAAIAVALGRSSVAQESHDTVQPGDTQASEQAAAEDYNGDENLPDPLPLHPPDAARYRPRRLRRGRPGRGAEQPIAFPHDLHAGQMQIDCEYCHTGARRSINAGVPPTQTCMNCHQMVDSTNRPELEKLKKYYADNEPIPWVKVHDLPDFVYFSHKRHVQGGVRCQECHGEVQDIMTVDRRVNTLEMGWCLNCHATHPKVDENYGAQAELRRTELKDCWTCHK